MRLGLCGALFAALLWAQNPDPDQLFRRAVDAQQAADYSTAITLYQQLLRLRPNFFQALANLGAALAHEQRFDEAIADYRAALKLHPGDTAIQGNLALALYKRGDFASAAAQFSSLNKAQPQDLRVATLLADCYLRLDQDQQAIDVLSPLQKSNPGNPDLLYVLGSAQIRSGHRHDGALLVEQAARLGDIAEAYMLAGSTFLDTNEFDQARHNLDAALKLNPNLPGLHTLSGIVRDKTGDYSGAEAALRTALEKNAGDFQANLTLGAILYKQRNLASARVYLERAVALNPASTLARYEFALWKTASGDISGAIQDLETVSRADPNWLEPHVQLAALYYRLHRQADGLREREIVDRLNFEQSNRSPSTTQNH